VAGAGIAPHARIAVDTELTGRQVSEWELWMITKQIPAFEAVSTLDLQPPQVSQMGRVFAVRPAHIEKFLWGPSMAPLAHRLAGTYWYTIWYADTESRQVITLRMDADRRIIERVRREQSAAANPRYALTN
jgi:hypothetical protein